MGLAQLSLASTGVPVTEMLFGGGPVGVRAAAAPDPGGGEVAVRIGVPDWTAMGAGATEGAGGGGGGGAGASGPGTGTDGVELDIGVMMVNWVCSATVPPAFRLACTS